MELEIIPFARRYEISAYGDIWDENGRKLKQSYSLDGYRNTTIYLNDGSYRNYRINRLVLATFIDDEPFFNPKIHCNHRDHVIQNNHYSNLEWLSSKMNNIHHALFTDSGNKVKLIAQHRSGEERCYNNIIQASIDLSIHELEIWDCIKLEVSYKGWRFYHRGYADRIPDSLRVNKQFSSRPREISVKDIKSGRVWDYTSLSSASRDLDVGISSIRSAMNGDKPRLLAGRYQVVIKGDRFPRITKDRINELKDRSGKEVYVRDLKSNRVIYYPSAKDFYLEHNLSKKRITTLLSSRKLTIVRDTIFCYSSDEELVKEINRTYGCPET